MNNSSAQESYSITSGSGVDVISIPTDYTFGDGSTITLTSTMAAPSMSSVTIGSGGSGYTYSSGFSGLTTAQISSLTVSDIKINLPQEWVDMWPQWDRIQKMCEEYPGLKIAFEKFKTTYHLVKDDYDTPKSKK